MSNLFKKTMGFSIFSLLVMLFLPIKPVSADTIEVSMQPSDLSFTVYGVYKPNTEPPIVLPLVDNSNNMIDTHYINGNLTQLNTSDSLSNVWLLAIPVMAIGCYLVYSARKYEIDHQINS